MTKIVHNKLLGGWFIVRGPHHTPISGRFNTKAEADAWLNRRAAAEVARAYFTNPRFRKAMEDQVWAILNPEEK